MREITTKFKLELIEWFPIFGGLECNNYHGQNGDDVSLTKMEENVVAKKQRILFISPLEELPL